MANLSASPTSSPLANGACVGRHRVVVVMQILVVAQWLPINMYERRHSGAGGGLRQAEFGGRASPCSDTPAPDPVPREGKVGTGAVSRPDRSPHNRGDPGLQLRLVTARGDERQHISRVTDQRRPLTPSPVLSLSTKMATSINKAVVRIRHML